MRDLDDPRYDTTGATWSRGKKSKGTAWHPRTNDGARRRRNRAGSDEYVVTTKRIRLPSGTVIGKGRRLKVNHDPHHSGFLPNGGVMVIYGFNQGSPPVIKPHNRVAALTAGEWKRSTRKAV